MQNNWLKCDGSTYSQSAYPILFSRLGLINNNGVLWSSVSYTTNLSYRPTGLSYGNGSYVLSTSNAEIFTSTDHLSWSSQTVLPGTTVQTMTFGGGLFLVGKNNGFIQTSTNGVSWSASLQVTASGGNGYVAYANGLYFASFGSYLFTSTNTSSWTLAFNFSGEIPYRVVYGAGLYAIATNQDVYTATTTTVWTNRTSTLTNQNLSDIAYGDNTFVAVGTGSGILKSVGGLSWEMATNTFTETSLFSANVIYGNGIFIANRSNGAIKTSTNADTWYNSVTPTLTGNTQTSYMGPLLYANSTYFVGQTNNIWSSPDAYPYNPATQFQVPIDNQTSVFSEGVNAFPRSMYIRALT